MKWRWILESNVRVRTTRCFVSAACRTRSGVHVAPFLATTRPLVSRPTYVMSCTAPGCDWSRLAAPGDPRRPSHLPWLIPRPRTSGCQQPHKERGTCVLLPPPPRDFDDGERPVESEREGRVETASQRVKKKRHHLRAQD